MPDNKNPDGAGQLLPVGSLLINVYKKTDGGFTYSMKNASYLTADEVVAFLRFLSETENRNHADKKTESDG